MEEIWKPVKGYEGLYEVSNKMRVRSVDRTVIYKNGKTVHHKGKILSQFKNGLYKGVHLWKDNVDNKKVVHHIVAEVFLPNPENKPIIDHIIPLSNGGEDVLSNLRWCTQKENMNNETTLQNLSNAFKGKKHTQEWKDNNSKLLMNHPKLSKKVYQYTLDGELVKVWKSMSEAGRNDFITSAICECCKGRRKSYKGYKWSYVPM